MFFVNKMETQEKLVSSFPKVLSHLSNTNPMSLCVFAYIEHTDVKTVGCLKISNCCMIYCVKFGRCINACIFLACVSLVRNVRSSPADRQISAEQITELYLSKLISTPLCSIRNDNVSDQGNNYPPCEQRSFL